MCIRDRPVVERSSRRGLHRAAGERVRGRARRTRDVSQSAPGQAVHPDRLSGAYARRRRMTQAAQHGGAAQYGGTCDAPADSCVARSPMDCPVCRAPETWALDTIDGRDYWRCGMCEASFVAVSYTHLTLP